MNEKEKKFGWKLAKQAFKVGGIVGASAVIGYLLRNQDLSGMRGFGKLFAGLGIIGLASAAGEVAGDALADKVESVEYASHMIEEIRDKYSELLDDDDDENEDDDTVADPI